MSNVDLDAKMIAIDRARETAEARPPEFADDALALLFAERHTDSLRYVAALGRWLMFDGARWRFDETLAARDLVRKICREASGRCDKKIAKTIASAKTVAAVERLAQTDRRIAATVEQFDADPWLLNTPAGIVDLRSGDMREHDARAYLTKITGIAPDDACPTPRWCAFLERIMGDDVIEYLRRVAGYSLTGSTQEHALFFCYGLGANGKSTFLNAITGCAGDYHRAAPIETFTASNHDQHPTDLAGLRGARLVTATETEEGRRWAESRIKALTGGDKIAARFMRQDFFEYAPQFKLIIAGNHKPGLRSVDEAIRRRFNLIPFTVTIPPGERDETLPAKLKDELPGILAWMILGCADWLERGLAPPQAVTAATAAYLEAEDAIAAWLEEAGERDPNAWEKSSDLFASWVAWATKAGEYIGTQKRFSQNLETRGLAFERRDYGRGFRGLRLPAPEYDSR
jgi:putative DNA primase/helicase